MIYVHVSGFISFEFYVLSPQLSGILIYQLQERQRLEEETDVGPLLHGNHISDSHLGFYLLLNAKE